MHGMAKRKKNSKSLYGDQLKLGKNEASQMLLKFQRLCDLGKLCIPYIENEVKS